MLDRRQVLGRAGAAGGLAIAALSATPALADEHADGAELEGGWIGNTRSGPNFPPFMALYTFAHGGGMVTSSSIDLSPRSLSTPGYGTWARTAPRAFAFTFDAFVFDAQGNPAGVVKARATAKLDEGGNAWSGGFKFDVIAPNGAIVFSGGGTHDATRIRVEPL
jgi:hypothetical protein